MSAIEDNVCKKIKARSDVGKEKYGVTMEEEILSMREWLLYRWSKEDMEAYEAENNKAFFCFAVTGANPIFGVNAWIIKGE